MDLSRKSSAKKRINNVVLAAFLLLVIALAGMLVYQNYFAKDSRPIVRARTVVPSSGAVVSSEYEENIATTEVAEYTSFIPLSPTETLLSSITFDFDGDNLDDQIIAIRKSDSPYVFLIVAIYIQNTNSYVRNTEIQTGISKVRSFTYAGMDITGTHRATLVFQGIRDDNMTVMELYNCVGGGENARTELIGKFESDGSIFIQESERSASYELLQSGGSSFPVWVYSSDINRETGLQGQLQTEYKWNASSRRYVWNSERHIERTDLAAEERARILDGNIETFTNFLNGLWYRIANEGGELRYLYFDYEAREIIFFYGQAQEVYNWADSNLNRNGMYLTSFNSKISNMQRRFDIVLSSGNTVEMRISDDVRSLVREASSWDGEYRKISMSSSLDLHKPSDDVETFKNKIENNSWLMDETYDIKFAEYRYTLTSANTFDSGAYTIYKLGDDIVLQFRSVIFPSGSSTKILSDAYRVHYEDNDIVLMPIALVANGMKDLESPTVRLVTARE